MGTFFADILKSMNRRRRDLRLLFCIWLVVAASLVSMLMYQEYSSIYKFENDKKNYGDWIITEIVELSEGQSKTVEDYAYFDKIGKVISGAGISDNTGRKLSAIWGYADEDFYEISRLTTIEGHIPNKSGEIAITTQQLQTLGLNYELGQHVQLQFYDKEAATLKTEDFELVGIVNKQLVNWCVDIMPSILFSYEDGSKIEGVIEEKYFFRLDSEYDGNTFFETYYHPIIENSRTAYSEGRIKENTYLYGEELFGNRWIYIALTALIIAIGLSAISFVQAMFINKRKQFYYTLRTIGATRVQIAYSVAVENLIVSVPGVLAGTLLATIAAIIVMYIVYSQMNISLFAFFNWDNILIVLGVWLGVLVVSTVMAIIWANRKKLYSNAQNITIKAFTRKLLNRLRANHLYRGIIVRQHRVFLVRSHISAIMGIATAVIMVFFASKLWQSYNEFHSVDAKMIDFTGCKIGAERTFPTELREGNGEQFISTEAYSVGVWQYYDGFDKETYAQIEDVLGVKDIRVSTYDNAHLFDWDSRLKEPHIEKYMNTPISVSEGINAKRSVLTHGDALAYIGKNNSLHLGYGAWFIDDSKVYKKYEKAAAGQQLDYEKFMAGEQVVVMLPGKTHLLKAGDDFRIETSGGIITVKVAAVINSNLVEYVDNSSSSMAGAKIYASTALGERMAQLEGKIFQYNRIQCNVDYFGNYIPSIKTLANIMETDKNYKIPTYINNSENRHKAFADLMNSAAIYGFFIVMVMAFYAVARAYMVQIGLVFYGNQVERLRILGMEKKRIKRMFFFEGLYESRFQWLSIVIVYIVFCWQRYMNYRDFEGVMLDSKTGVPIEGVWNMVWAYIDKDINLWVSIIMVLIIMTITVMTRYLVVYMHLKKQE